MEKSEMRTFLFDEAVKALEEKGWQVERIPRIGKASVRRITKDGVSKRVSIRTSQDTWIAFPRNAAGTGWATLEDVDYVIASSVDSLENPQFINVHMIDASDMRNRFDRAYAARTAANHKIDAGRGIWLSLYEKDTPDPVALVGAGAGLDNPAIAHIPLSKQTTIDVTVEEKAAEKVEKQETRSTSVLEADEIPLTIAEAKRRLALSLGVKVSEITITVSS